MLVQKLLYLNLPLANPMTLIPMYLSKPDFASK